MLSYGDSYFFAGGGLGYTQTKLELNSVKSEFRGSNYFLTGGAVLGGGKGNTGLLLKGDVGRGQGYNLLKSESYMEMIETTYATAKVGIIFGFLAVGGGFSFTELKVKSVSNTTGAAETKESQGIPIYFISYTVPNPKQLRTEVELQYKSGKIGLIHLEEVSLLLSLSLILD